MRLSNLSGLLALLAILLGQSIQAEAAPIFFTSLQGSAQAGAQVPNNFLTGLLFGIETHGPLTAQQSDPDAFALASARADNGTVGVSAFASDSPIPLGNSGGTATANATFRDTLTVVSSTLPIGTPVSIAVALTLTRAFNISSCTDAFARINAQLTLGGLAFEEQACAGVVTNNVAAIVPVVIGQEIQFDAVLDAIAIATFGSFASVDAMNTLRFTIDPLSQFSYVTASGNSYLTTQTPGPTPVPEPATLLLVGAGLIGAVRASRRR